MIEANGEGFSVPKIERMRKAMKTRRSAFLSGCLTTLLLLALGTSVLAASGQISFNVCGVAVDGETEITAGSTVTASNGQQIPSSILYTDATGGGTNYLPLRTISELLGVEVGYDAATKTAYIGQQPEPAAGAEKHWQRTVDGTTFTYTSQRPETPYTTPPSWGITWLPEGWALTETTGGTTRSGYNFSGPEGRVRFVCAYPDKGSIGSSVRYEDTIQNCRQVTIQGYPADLYVEDEWTYLVWEGQDGILFWFSGTGVSVEDLTEIAEGAQPIAEQLPDYQLSWVPDGYTQFEQIAVGSAVQETWIGPDDTSLTLLYAAEPVELPESTPETVQVRGVDAQFWAAAEPHTSSGSMTVNGEEVEGNQTEIGGVSISVGTIAGPNAADASTLAWQDPDTGLYFRIHGTVDRDTLLRIAEWVEQMG